jgi:hypothetical protein
LNLFNIANQPRNNSRWLEFEYPETASLFVPTQTSSHVDKTALNLAKNYHSYLSSTFGSPSLSGSASPFSAFFAAVAEEGILGLIKEEKVSTLSDYQELVLLEKTE